MILLIALLAFTHANETPYSKSLSKSERKTWGSLKNENSSIFNPCIADVCEDHEIMDFSLEVDAENIKKADEFEARFSKTYKNVFQHKIKMLNVAQKQVEKGDISDRAQLAIEATRMAHHMVDEGGVFYIKTVEGDDRNYLKPDLSEIQKAKSLTPELKKYYTELSKTVAAVDKINLYNLAQRGFTAPMAYRIASKNSDYQTHVRADAQEAISIINKLKNEFSEAEISAMGIKTHFFQSIVQKNRAEFVTEELGTATLKESSRVHIINEILNSKKIKTIHAGLSKKGKDFLLYQNKDKKSFLSNMTKASERWKEMSPQDETVIRNCRNNYAVNLQKLPSKEQITKAKIIFASTKKNFVKAIPKFFSSETSSNIQEYLNSKDTELYFPNSKEEFESDVNLMTNQIDKNLGDESGSLTPLLLYSSTSYNTVPLNLEIYNYCNSIEYKMIRDFTSDVGGVVVSSEAVKNINFGKGVLAHELGHRISYYMRKGKISQQSGEHFSKIKKCLSDLHKNEMARNLKEYNKLFKERPDFPKHPLFKHYKKVANDSEHYLEEDIADLLSISSIDEGNVACGFMRVNGANESSIFHSDGDIDTHSTSLFRLIHNEKVRRNGKLPASCEKALETSPDKENIRNCLL